VFIRAIHCFLSSARWTHSILPHPIFLRSTFSLCSLFSKTKGGLWDHFALCQSVLSEYSSLIFVRRFMRSPCCLWICVHESVCVSPFLLLFYPAHVRKAGHWFFPEFLVILSYHLRLGLPSGLFLLAFPLRSYTYSSSPPCVLRYLPISHSLSWSFW
jgi:hypothetical protein